MNKNRGLLLVGLCLLAGIFYSFRRAAKAPQAASSAAAVADRSQQAAPTALALDPAAKTTAVEATIPPVGELAQSLKQIETYQKNKDTSALIGLLKPEQATLVQDTAMEALTQLNAREALPAIAALASSQDAVVLTQVMKSLSSLAARSAVASEKIYAIEKLEAIYQQYTNMASTQDSELHRSNAIEALGRLQHPRSGEILLEKLDETSSDAYMQYYIVTALGNLAEPRALAALQQLESSIPELDKPKTEEELTQAALLKAIAKASQKIHEAVH